MSWLPALALGGALTFATRVSFIVLFAHVEPPPLVRRGLRLVPPAVLSAIILPELLIRDGAVDPSLRNPRLVAGAIAAAIAWFTRNVPLTIAGGMMALWALQRFAS
jgi:branched-subunit amino acid transport protein